jgi:ProP effector
MGFEQLASLKSELAKQAIAEKVKQRTEKPAKKMPIDPLVQIIGQLQKQYPLAFPKKPLSKVPLKIGIHKDLLEQSETLGISKKELRAAVKKWCRGKRYAECLIAGAARIDLNGNEVGQVSKEEAAQAEQHAKRNANSPSHE